MDRSTAFRQARQACRSRPRGAASAPCKIARISRCGTDAGASATANPAAIIACDENSSASLHVSKTEAPRTCKKCCMRPLYTASAICRGRLAKSASSAPTARRPLMANSSRVKDNDAEDVSMPAVSAGSSFASPTQCESDRASRPMNSAVSGKAWAAKARAAAISDFRRCSRPGFMEEYSLKATSDAEVFSDSHVFAVRAVASSASSSSRGGAESGALVTADDEPYEAFRALEKNAARLGDPGEPGDTGAETDARSAPPKASQTPCAASAAARRMLCGLPALKSESNLASFHAATASPSVSRQAQCCVCRSSLRCAKRVSERENKSTN
mmetsp:Transcript_18995/g.65288  ORF Transcript_18995/g.65288 Transcript_18995/m.65288 type:complete len:328 (-) Transcript_18995:3516-4499(-)